MSDKKHKPVIAILADVPLGRLFPEKFRDLDKVLVPWVYALFEDLSKQNDFEIHWITLKRHCKKDEVCRFGTQTVHVIPAPSLAISLFTGHFTATRIIRKKLKEIKPDIIHIWGVELYYAKACAKLKTPKLLTYQGCLTACCQRAPMKFYPKLIAFWERRTTPHYQRITCESPWAKERVLELSPNARIDLIEYGVEESFFTVNRAPSATPECLFVGTLYELKGIRYLVEAFKCPELSHVQLYLAGVGDLRAELESGCTPNIHWTGQLSRDELQKRMETAWCLVHPTLADTGPTIVKEARVAGLPVITTTEAGSKQYVVEGKSGHIIPPRNSDAIIKAVLSITASRSRAIEMGLYGLTEDRNKLSVNKTTSQFFSLYRELPGTAE